MGYVEEIMGANERLLYRTRRHWLVIAPPFVLGLITSLLIVALVAVIVSMTSSVMSLLLLLVLLPLGRLTFIFLHYWNEQYIVTSHRIIQIEGIFNKHVIDSSLEKVNDVVLDQSVLGRLLGYGDIEILTASEVGINKLEKMSNPILFKTTMLDAKDQMASDNDGGPFGHRAHDEKSITELIGQLATLRDRGAITDQEFQGKKNELLSRL
jgi:hypothetical protein